MPSNCLDVFLVTNFGFAELAYIILELLDDVQVVVVMKQLVVHRYVLMHVILENVHLSDDLILDGLIIRQRFFLNDFYIALEVERLMGAPHHIVVVALVHEVVEVEHFVDVVDETEFLNLSAHLLTYQIRWQILICVVTLRRFAFPLEHVLKLKFTRVNEIVRFHCNLIGRGLDFIGGLSCHESCSRNNITSGICHLHRGVDR